MWEEEEGILLYRNGKPTIPGGGQVEAWKGFW